MSRTPEAVRQLTNPPKEYFIDKEIKIVILPKPNTHYSNAYIFRFVF